MNRLHSHDPMKSVRHSYRWRFALLIAVAPCIYGYDGHADTIIDSVQTAPPNIIIPDTLTVGNYLAYGALTVSAGGIVSNADSFIGNFQSDGHMTVTGAGATWINSGSMYIANYQSSGTLIVSNGGNVSSVNSFIGNTDSNGVATVTGTGSTWTNSADIYVGNTSASGTLTVSEGGTLTTNGLYLAVNNASGTLNIGAASGDTAVAAGYVNAAQVVFGNGAGKIVFNHTNTDYEFAAALIGYGTVEFLSGTTILTGDISAFSGQFTGNAGLRFTPGTTTELTTDQSSFAGTTTVADNSTLTVNGALGGTTIVENGGHLKGNGTFGDLTVDNGGSIAPGNSIGITNATNVTFNPGSTYEVELNSAGQSDIILATNTATLNGGTVEAIPFPDYRIDHAYTILTATGGVTGMFDDGISSTPFLDALLSYDTHNVYLTLTPNSSAVDAVASTPNQRAVADITTAQAGSLSFAADLYSSADAATFRAGLDSLSGEIHASTAGALIGEQQRLRSSILTDTRVYDTSLTLGDTIFWTQGFGSFGSTSGTANTARMTHDNAGVLVGAERRVDDRRAGIAIGASRSHMEQGARDSRATSDNVHLIAYTGNRGGVGKMQHTVGASLSLHSIDTSRNVTAGSFNDTSKADYSGRSAEIFTEFAHPLAAGGKATLTPYLQGAVTVQQQDGFTETGTAGLTAGTSTTRVASTILGTRYERPFGIGDRRILHASIGAAWQHLYGDDTPDTTMGFTQAPASRFSVEGAPLARDAALLSASLTTKATDNLALSLGYDASLASELTAHALYAQGKYGF